MTTADPAARIGACYDCGTNDWYPTGGKTEAGEPVYECRECGEFATPSPAPTNPGQAALLVTAGLIMADILSHSKQFSALLTGQGIPTEDRER